MYNYKLTIQYDGGRYKGWQKLGADENTIQGKLMEVLTEFSGERTEVIGCSRTDAGVHALGQVANVKLNKQVSPEELKEYLNRYLPQDIRILEVTPVSVDFHARYLAKRKTYLYQIWNREHPNPFRRRYSMHVPVPLDMGAIRAAAPYFIGVHDFTAFSNAKARNRSMIKTIYSIEISSEEGMLLIRICGDGFLYNMVRKMIGVLIEIGLGRLPTTEVAELLKEGDRSRLTVLAEACGLFLECIEY